MASWWNSSNFNHLPRQKSPATVNLLQNCDLPPPSKLFAGADDPTVAKSLNRDYEDHEKLFRPAPLESQLELLRALRLSQTRAREAETTRAEIQREKDYLSDALAEEAMRAFGYRQLLMLMEFEVSRLRSEARVRRQWTGDPPAEHGVVDGAFPWIVAVAFCAGVVGVVVAFAC